MRHMWIVEVTKMVRYELAIIPNKMKKKQRRAYGGARMVLKRWRGKGTVIGINCEGWDALTSMSLFIFAEHIRRGADCTQGRPFLPYLRLVLWINTWWNYVPPNMLGNTPSNYLTAQICSASSSVFVLKEWSNSRPLLSLGVCNNLWSFRHPKVRSQWR